MGPLQGWETCLEERKMKMLRHVEEIIMVLRDGKEGAAIP